MQGLQHTARSNELVVVFLLTEERAEENALSRKEARTLSCWLASIKDGADQQVVLVLVGGKICSAVYNLDKRAYMLGNPQGGSQSAGERCGEARAQGRAHSLAGWRNTHCGLRKLGSEGV